MNLTQLILLVLKISIALSVLAVALKATPDDATFLLRHPRQLGAAFFSMNVLMPLFALFVALNFSLNPAVKIALVALSVSPVPPFLPAKALKAGGRENYAIGLLTSMALLAIVVVPVAMKLFERVSGVPLEMPALAVTRLVVSTILAPLLIGICLHAAAPRFAESAAKPTSLVATVLLVLSLIPVLFASSRAMFSLIGNGTILTLAAFAIVGLIVGHLLGGPESESRSVLSLATASRHPGIAAAIAHTNFPNQKLAVPAIALYLIIAAILSALASTRSKSVRRASVAARQSVR